MFIKSREFFCVMDIKVELVKAFTKDKNQGNPAGVVLDADGLTEKQMMKISAELGFSESAFVQKSDKADYKVRFFTPTHEFDLCGHATIATFYSLVKSGRIKIKGECKDLTQETKAGILPVTCYKNGLIVMTQSKPKFYDVIDDRKGIAGLLNITKEDITELPMQIVSTGAPKLMIPISSLDALFSIKPDFEGIKKYCKKVGAKGFHCFTSETIDKYSDFHVRQFAPLVGVDEDPITGIAAGALCAYIKHYNLSDKTKFVIEQGYVMKKAGKIYVDVSDKVKVGGYAVNFGEKNIRIT